ncbi:DNA recombination protein RmuC [Catenulispora pinisilvae]|uniref:DNA recombination protein RmuC n=1 Tax=Catenulispora pinisilvae TaxID=2705253 RepID=UPI001E30F820|nr:DNA recombination protein RmuC [Catenulispora pinisilvae]
MMPVLLLVIGIAFGVLLGVLWERSRRLTMNSQALDQSADRLLALAGSQFDAAGRPINESLSRLDDRLREIERGRAASQAALAQQIDDVRTAAGTLGTQTAALVTALRRPEVRGQWGEMHLRRAVELAGMVDRCDFETQTVLPGSHGATGSEGMLRPDLVVRLAGDKYVVVDAKTPLAAYLDAAEATDEADRQQFLTAHAKHLRVHVDQLASKAYWRALGASGRPTPEFVVLFVPGEAFLSQAVDIDPELLEYAATRRVVIATPTTLIALLRTVAYAWTQDSLAANARQVFELGRELYARLNTMSGHLDRVGKGLNSAVAAYNQSVGSLETRVLVTARRLNELGLVDEELAVPAQVESQPRTLAD